MLFAVAAFGLAATSAATADEALARSKGCTTCHSAGRKLVGPAYRDVAAKYKGDSAAAGKLATKIMKGGNGVWGPVPMPATTQMTESEAKKLAAWILSLK
jgi:cytochrome c